MRSYGHSSVIAGKAKMSVGRAIVIGMFWVNGSAMVGFALPIVVVGLISFMTGAGDVGGPAVLIGMVLTFLLSFVVAWFAWSVQVPRWRVWAYRRVSDIGALKASAVSAGLIWPEGHLFQRTELRTAAQSSEINHLEEAAAIRPVESLEDGKTSAAPTPVGTAFKALVFGLICTPLCMLAPAGLLTLIGFEIISSPIYWGLVAAFPVLLAAVIYRRALRDGITADEGFRRSLPRGIRREDGSD
jgi:hypothetical protein